MKWSYKVKCKGIQQNTGYNTNRFQELRIQIELQGNIQIIFKSYG